MTTNPNRIHDSNAEHMVPSESWAEIKAMSVDELAAELTEINSCPIGLNGLYRPTQEWLDRASTAELLEVFGSDYDNSLNDIDGDIEVAGYSFQASDILKNMDYEVYRQGLFDYIDMLHDDLPSEDDLNG